MSATIVTGAAGGIGLAVARRILDADPAAACALVDAHVDGLAALRGEHGEDRVLVLACDVTDPAEVADAAASVAAWTGDVRGLVAAAGNASDHDSASVSREQWHAVLDVHLDGTLYWCQQAAPMMRDAGGGSIVCLSSVVARFGHPGRMAYACAKAGIEELVRTLAVEWAPLGIRTNAVAPGYVETEMVRALDRQNTISLVDIAGAHALNRLAQPEEIADPIHFLLSERASFVTGEVLTVDGGFSIRKHENRKAADASIGTGIESVG